MKPIVYNASIASGIVLVAGGCYALWGGGVAAIAAGAQILGFTLFGACVGGRDS